MDSFSRPYENIYVSFSTTLSLSLPSCMSLGVSFPCVELGISALLVPQGRCYKWPQTGCLKTTEMYSLKVPEVRCLESRCWQGHCSSEGSRWESINPPRSLLFFFSLPALSLSSLLLPSPPPPSPEVESYNMCPVIGLFYLSQCPQGSSMSMS